MMFGLQVFENHFYDVYIFYTPNIVISNMVPINSPQVMSVISFKWKSKPFVEKWMKYDEITQKFSQILIPFNPLNSKDNELNIWAL